MASRIDVTADAPGNRPTRRFFLGRQISTFGQPMIEISVKHAEQVGGQSMVFGQLPVARSCEECLPRSSIGTARGGKLAWPDRKATRSSDSIVRGSRAGDF